MSQSIKKQSSEDLMASLMEELKLVDLGDDNNDLILSDENIETLDLGESSNSEILIDEKTDFGSLDLNFGTSEPAKESADNIEINLDNLFNDTNAAAIKSMSEPDLDYAIEQNPEPVPDYSYDKADENNFEKTVAIASPHLVSDGYAEGDRTVAVAGYSNRANQSSEENVKISVGQSAGGSSGYGGWGSTDSNLAQAENLKIAQSKILELERDNEKLRHQNEELVSASEIVRERSDLLTAQVYEYKNDRESLEGSFKSEMSLVKSQLNRKDVEFQKAQMKIDELDSRLKFDMKKIRIRERELENRLELIRAEKNALVRSKDEQILDSRRKIDQLQLEVDSFRQKCVDLNRVLETNQDSFKRTTRALRLAMANLELQDENKTPLKKVD